MAGFRGLLLSTCLLIAHLVSASPNVALPLGMQDFSGAGAPLQVFSLTPEYTSITLPSTGVVSESRVVNFEDYQVYGIPGESFVMEEGVPAIPQVARFYRIPNTGSVELVLSNTDDYELLENVDVMPLQLEGSENFGLARSSVYDQDQWYPSSVAEMSAPQIMRDFRVVRVVLYPVQVNPVTRQVRIYHNLHAELVANDAPGENELLNPRQPSGAWEKIYRNMIANLDDSALDDISVTPGGYLVLSHNNTQAREWADSLYTWKKRKGFNVVIDARSNWTVSAMTQAIQTAYQTWDPPLEFVALIGDPAWSYGVPSGSTSDGGGDFDHIFALGNNGDDLEDIGVGRLSGNSSAQMNTIHAKLMGYERDPFMADTMWYHRGFFYGSVGHSIASNYTLMQWGAQQFAEMTGVNMNEAAHTPDAANTALVISKFNLGISFFFWRGSWLGQMDNTLAGQTNPGWKLPVVLTVTCGAGNFVQGLGTQESYLVAGTATQPRGGIAAIGSATSSTHAPQNITVTGGLIYYIADAGLEHLGPALNGAKMWLARLWGPSSTQHNQFSRFNNLMGDPGLSMWTQVPRVMESVHATTVNVGARHFAVDVRYQGTTTPVADALVVLWKGNETYARGLTDANGLVELPITVNTPGELLLTITKHNHKPYLYTVNCAPAAQMVALSSYTVDDDNAGGTNGNSNGLLNPGELIDLPLYLKNFGTSGTATGVSATLASDNPRVAVVNGNSTFANIAAGDSAQAATAYRIQVSPQMQHGETALLTWTVTASSVQTTSSLEFTCQAGRPDYVSHLFTGTVNPGTTNQLRVTVRNGGLQPLNGATAQLHSLSPFVQVDDAQGTFGDIPVGQQIANTNDQFSLTSNSLTFRGHQAPMRLILSTSNGFVDTVQFSVAIGAATAADPTGPDAYGYFAYDNTDVTYEMAPTFNYVNISAGLGQNLNIADIGDKTLPTQVWSTVRQLPFPFTFYGETYDTVTVCSNGWLAFGNQGFNDNFRNYPIPAMQAPDAMIAPFWDDLKTSGSGLGVWQYHDAAEHRYIVQWKAQGAFNTTNLDFQVILLDEEFYPTFDGNGQVLVQYNDVTMGINGDPDEPHGCTIGIQKPGNTVGLSYAFIQTYSPGAASVVDGRSIMFTTNARMLFGAVQGTVLDAETNQGIPNADVTIDGYSYHVLTDATGHYFIDDVLIGSYTVRAHKRAFNDAIVADVVVALDSTSTADFSLLHPEFALSVDTLMVALPEQPEQTSFEIQNAGNGPLDYTMTITYAGDGSAEPWDNLENVTVSQATNDYLIQGCEFGWDHWYISGAGTSGQPMLYRFDTDGNYAGAIAQPAGGIGWFDMAFDEEFLYGSQSNPLNGWIVGIDAAGQIRDSIPSPVNPTRALAYAGANDHFWVADFTSDIFELDRDGNIVQQVTNEGPGELNITGLAWWDGEPDGFKLLLFCTNGSGTQLWKMHPVSHDRQLVTALAANPGEHAGGLAITPGWNSTLLVLGGILQGTSGDRLGIYEVSFNTTWITVSPMQATVPGANEQEVTVLFDPTYLRTDVYRVNLNIHSAVLDTTYIMPVVLAVTSDAENPGNDGVVPTEYALHQNYPNPFNPSTTIRYDLKEAGQTRLSVYNLMGQEVAVLVNQVQQAGVYRINFEAAALPSGVYFYRVHSGSFVQTAKMVLMK